MRGFNFLSHAGRAKEILGATATLEFRMVDEEHNAAVALKEFLDRKLARSSSNRRSS